MNFLRRQWNSTIRFRLTVLYAGAFFIAGLALIAVMYFQLNEVVGQRFVLRREGPAVTTSVTVQRMLDPAGAAGAVPGASPATPTGASETLFANMEEQMGKVLAESLASSVRQGPDFFANLEAQMEQARTETLRRILLVSVLSLVGVGAIATLLGYLLAGQALQPLRQITTTARSIADRNLHQRIAMQGPDDEIKDLADTLDNMLERLDRAFDGQQRFIANAAHELRTPLAINRTLIEVAMLKEPKPDTALAQLGTTLLAVNQRHERLIDGLLMLASSEQEVADPQAVELAEVAQHALMESAAMARSAGVDVRSLLDASSCVGDPVLLERLIRNLTDNAIRYNVPENGWVRVTTQTNAQGQAVLSVENSGPQIPPYEVPRLFEPFRRLPATERIADSSGSLGRRGAGLGLSIVRSIVNSHRGEVNAVARADGGLLITIVMPAQKFHGS